MTFGPGGTAAVITTSGRAEVITSGSRQWQTLPAVPPSTATLAGGPGGSTDALAVHDATLTVWQLPRNGSDWVQTQAISVPIEYGSSS